MQAYTRWIRRNLPLDIVSILNNKDVFRHHCRKHGLESIPTVAVVRGGDIQWEEGNDGLPKADLFAKPTDGMQGVGVVQWQYQDGSYLRTDGQRCSAEDVIRDLMNRSKERVFVLQPRIINHPKLHELAGEALCCARIVTIRPSDSPARIAISIFSSAINKAHVSNWSSGGMSMAVVNGILGRGYRKEELFSVPADRHSDSRVKIAGLALPHWSEAEELTRHAHETLPGIPMIGWDVAITPEGPILVEGNIGFGVEAIQVVHQMPLALTGIPGVCLLAVAEP